MADTENSGAGRDGLAEFGRMVAEDATRAGAVLGAWLERQGAVVAAALAALPAGMAPATQASNVLAALLAAASGRPVAEGPRAELDQLAARHWRLTGLATQVALWISERDTADLGLAAEVAAHLAILEEAEALKQEQVAADAAPKGMSFGRRNPHCSRCGDERGGDFGHEASECRYRPGMTAAELAATMPPEKQARFWEQAVEQYFERELAWLAEQAAVTDDEGVPLDGPFPVDQPLHIVGYQPPAEQEGASRG